MKIEFTDAFQSKVRKLVKKDPHLKATLQKQFHLFQSNPAYPSLHLHKLIGKRSEQYAISIKGDLRALAIQSRHKKDTFIFFDLVTHDDYITCLKP